MKTKTTRATMGSDEKNADGIDFISDLPLEVAEELIGYLEGEDILIGCQVCREWKARLDQEHIWKRLCTRRGWDMDRSTGSGWRNVYWLNRNWSTGRFKQYTINGDDLHPTQHRSFQMDGNYLIVPRATSLYKSTGINIWDLTDEPRLHQVIFNELGPKGKQFRAYKRFIVQQIGSFIRIHKNINGKYEHFKLLHFKENVRFNGGIFQVVSDVEEIKQVERFTPPIFEDELTLDIELECNMLSVYKHKKFIYLWNLDPWKPVAAVNIDGDPVSYVRIVPGRLFCVMTNSPIFRVYDLVNKVWLMELNGNSRDPLFDINPSTPTLHLGPSMISSYYKSGSESTFKIWDSNGELVRMIDLPRNVHFQCPFTDDCILITSSELHISVLSYTLDEIKKIDIESPCEAMDAGAGNFFVLVYQTFYQVWDWKSGTKKYTIDLPMSVTRQVNPFFCAHEIHHHNHKIKINVLNYTRDVKIPASFNYSAGTIKDN